MKKINLLIIACIAIMLTSLTPSPVAPPCYDSRYVEIANVYYKNETYNVVTLKRDSSRVNAKYFAAKDYNGNSVYKRYTEWAASKNIILVSSGTYMDNYGTPVGLTIDNGVKVNETLAAFDGLVIVYATGGVVVSNIDDADLTVIGGNIPSGKKFNLRNALDKTMFINWAKDQEATVFQTHLLAYKNSLKIDKNTSSQEKRERRFLAVGKDEKGKVIHLIIHSPSFVSLYEGARRTLEFLNDYKYMEVIFMINLDTGYQDVFKLFNKDCSVNESIKGQKELSVAVNLLAYYFQ